MREVKNTILMRFLAPVALSFSMCLHGACLDEARSEQSVGTGSSAPKASLKAKLPGGVKGEDDVGKLPTFIKSDTLSLKSDQRTFRYEGNVEVRQGDMILTCKTLDGFYSTQNQIDRLIALGNVVIVKGDGTRANGEKAVYESSTRAVTLTDNPELQQNGSILTADSITIFMKDNRSVATGSVRVKLVKKDAGTGESPTSLLALGKGGK